MESGVPGLLSKCPLPQRLFNPLRAVVSMILRSEQFVLKKAVSAASA